jgi:hypothetical protein
MAKMGLGVKDDPKKVVDIAGRTWGEPAHDLALSVLLKPKEDPDELPAISVAIQNRNAVAQRLTTHGWLDFYRVSVTDPAGAAAAMTPYGRELLKPERRQTLPDITLSPGEAIEADIPIGSIFQMRKRQQYAVQVSCEAPGGSRVTSNQISVQA